MREIAPPQQVGSSFREARPLLPVALARARQASGVVTNPVNKAALYGAGFRHPGHTEFLAAITGAPNRPVMMLACPVMRVVPVTIYLALREVIAALDVAAITETCQITHAALRRDFGIAWPRLSVAGLNPHAAEKDPSST